MPIHPIQATLDVLGRDSRLGHGATEVVSYLMDLLYFGEFSIFEQVSSGWPFERVNLIGSKTGNSDRDPLWLISHLHGSAQPAPARWASCRGEPMRPRVVGGAVHGLGACGGKVDAVLKILAASRFRVEDLRRPIYVVALSGEEATGSGMRSLLATGPTPRGVAVVHAPTNLELWTAHPGCVTIKLALNRRLRHRRMPPSRGFYELRIDGRSAHAQAPALGVNALERGLAVLTHLRAHADARILGFDAGEAPNRVPGHCTLRVATSEEQLPDLGPDVHITPIADGTALPFPLDALFESWVRARDAGIRAVTDRLGLDRNPPAARPRIAAATGWLRTDRNAIDGAIMLWTGPGANTQEICERFAAAVQQALIGADEIEVELEVIQDRPAFSGGEAAAGPFQEAVEAAARNAGLIPTYSGGALTTDAGLIREVGMETLVFGPGRGVGDLYRDDESVPVAHLEAAFRFYEDLIQRWCVG